MLDVPAWFKEPANRKYVYAGVAVAVVATVVIVVAVKRRNTPKTTEQFFAHGVENWDDYHDGYLNFGLWENGITDYLAASERLLGRVAEKVGLNAESDLLDVGCGMGMQDVFFARKFGVKKITAVDLTSAHVAQAKKRLEKPEYKKYVDNITYNIGNACDLSKQRTDFTHIISIEAPVNFCTRQKFFQEAFAHLRPGGHLGASDFYMKKQPESATGQFFMRMCAHFWHIPKDNIYGLGDYKAKLEQAGFTDVDLEEVGDDVVPGYYFEQKKVLGDLARIRGWTYARLGLFLDYVTYRLWQEGILGYVLVGAKKG